MVPWHTPKTREAARLEIPDSTRSFAFFTQVGPYNTILSTTGIPSLVVLNVNRNPHGQQADATGFPSAPGLTWMEWMDSAVSWLQYVFGHLQGP
jgi:hypothetical protein